MAFSSARTQHRDIPAKTLRAPQKPAVTAADAVRLAARRSVDGEAEITELLSAGIYYFAVEAQGDAKKSGTNYDIDLSLERQTPGMLA